MRQVLVMMGIGVFAIPVMAAVNFTATDAGGGKLQIAYTTTDGDLPRGVALRISCGDGAVLDIAAPFVADPAFNTFPDYAYSNPLNYAVGNGHPLAKSTEAGALDADASDFSISMGVLDQTGNQSAGPATTTNLITVQLKGVGCPTTVTISADTLRGPASGVVGSVLSSNLPITVEVLNMCGECLKWSAPEYPDWVAWGKPACWCYRRQCRGDINGKKEPIGTAQIGATDLNTFKSAFGKNPTDLAFVSNGICADLNHAKEKIGTARVGATDLGQFKLYYGKAAAAIPECDFLHYKFWLTP
ncbi:MAG: hypothetical protein GX455_07230 [Phycisphaerae bacterium]|nr:hypothetical protein [Phycisphaerae bacterium]